MNNIEKQEAANYSRVLRASRKLMGLSQSELSKNLEMSQSMLSKVENEVLIPSAPIWYRLCKILEIQADCGVKGYIDSRKDAKITGQDRLGNFKIPRRYAYLQGSMARTSLPLIHYFQKKLGSKKIKEFIKSKRLDPDYFVIRDVPLNINFNLDLLRALIELGHLKKDDIPELAGFMKESLMHGELNQDYETTSGPKDLLKALEKNILKYDVNCRYNFDLSKKDTFEIECIPEAHLKEFDYKSGSLDTLVFQYKKNLLHHFLIQNKFNVKQIDGIETIYEGGDKCVYQIHLV